MPPSPNEYGSPNHTQRTSTQSGELPKSSLTRIRSWWAKSGITWSVYQLTLKVVVPPVIALSAYQSSAWSNYFTTLGYLIGVVTILCMPHLPRAKFLESIFILVVFVCLAFCLTLLAYYCCVSARAHTEDSSGPASYNSSASAVAAVWLFVQIYAITTLRASLPQYGVPCVLWAIYTDVAMTYAPQFVTMHEASIFAQHLFEAYLTAIAISTAVSLLLFPKTSREAMFQDIKAFIVGTQELVRESVAYLNDFEGEWKDEPRIDLLHEKTRALQTTYGKLIADVPYARRELAIGMLGPNDLEQLSRLSKDVMIAATGLGCTPTTCDSAASTPHAARDKDAFDVVLSAKEWKEILQIRKTSFDQQVTAIEEGLRHVAIVLKLVSDPEVAHTDDVQENCGDLRRPGDKAFSQAFDRRCDDFLQDKVLMMHHWRALCDAMEMSNQLDNERSPIQHQLATTLHTASLLYTISRRIYELVIYVDRLNASDKLRKRRLIVPEFKQIWRWLVDTARQSYNVETEENIYGKARYVEHLPPANKWEHATSPLRKLGHFFASGSSIYALRVAIATTCVAVICYLEQTQAFFLAQRLFWAEIMVSIGLLPSTGQSLRATVLRIAGNFTGMVLSFVAYYITNKTIAGSLVFLFLFFHIGAFIVVKFPTRALVGLLVMISMVIILGYELQERKIGIQKATSNGQQYYPIYIEGPVRLLVVTCGLFVSWFWTIFPWPISDHSQMRENIAFLLHGLARYNTLVQETIAVRAAMTGENGTAKNDHLQSLKKARRTLFSKCNALLVTLKGQAGLVKFDIPIGGKFPVDQYNGVVKHLESMFNLLVMISVASASLSGQDLTNLANKRSGTTIRGRSSRELVGRVNEKLKSATLELLLLSGSMRNSQALPPRGSTFEVDASTLQDRDLACHVFNVEQMAELDYGSFITMEIGTRGLVEQLVRLRRGIKSLVGELFSADTSSVNALLEDGLHDQQDESE